MASSYPHSMAPCRRFSNRKKNCIWKHNPTIYMPIKQWDVNINALTPCNAHPHPERPSLAWFCYGTANTPFCENPQREIARPLFLTHCWATEAEKSRKNELEFGGVQWNNNKSTTYLQRNASTNNPFSHNATFKSVIWTRVLRQRLCVRECDTKSEEMLPLVSVCILN